MISAVAWTRQNEQIARGPAVFIIFKASRF